MVLAIELSDGIWVLYPKIYSLAHNGAGLAFPMLHLCVSYFLELGPIPKYTSAIGDYRKSTHAEQGHKNSQLNSEKILKPIRRSMQDLQANYSLWCNIIPSPDSFVASNRCTVEDLVSCQEPMINVETWEEGCLGRQFRKENVYPIDQNLESQRPLLKLPWRSWKLDDAMPPWLCWADTEVISRYR